MKVIIIIIVASLCSLLGLHQYSNSRYAKLEKRYKSEKRNAVKLQMELKSIEEKYKLESKKSKELQAEIKKLKQEDEKRQLEQKNVQENARKNIEKVKVNAEKIAVKQKQINDLKAKLAFLQNDTRRAEHSKTEPVNVEEIRKQIRVVQGKIDIKERQLKKISDLIADKRLECYVRCIYASDVKFTRKMNKNCRVTVPGGTYYCEHYDRTDRYYTRGRRRNHEIGTYRYGHYHDSETPVRYQCRTHNISWNRGTADSYSEIYKNNSALLGNRLKYANEVAYLKRSLAELVENEQGALNQSSPQKQTANNREKETVIRQIQALESEIEELIK